MARSTSYAPRFVVSLALAIGSIALAQPAFADDTTPPAEASGPVATAPAATPPAATPPAATAPAAQPSMITQPGAADPTATATAPAEAKLEDTTVVEEPAPRFPRSVIARPLTLPKGLAMLGADAIANNDFSSMLGAPIVGYGITDKIEVQVPYTFATRELEGRGSVAVDVGYAVVRGALDGKLEMIARVRGGYDTLGEAATPLMIGVHAQYNATPWLALISGIPGTQQLRISLAEDAAMATPVDFSLPLGVGIQATPELYLQADTKLATINLSDSANALLFKDTTPASLTAVYNVINALDVQAAIGTDLTNTPGDNLFFLLGARYYAGQL